MANLKCVNEEKGGEDGKESGGGTEGGNVNEGKWNEN